MICKALTDKYDGFLLSLIFCIIEMNIKLKNHPHEKILIASVIFVHKTPFDDQKLGEKMAEEKWYVNLSSFLSYLLINPVRKSRREREIDLPYESHIT